MGGRPTGTTYHRSNERAASFAPHQLRELRLAHGLSLRRLAALVDEAAGAPRGAGRLDLSQLECYERGVAKPGIEILHELAAALGVEPSDLMTATPDTATVSDLRVRAGIRRAEFIHHLGVTSAAWANIEFGREPLDENLTARAAELLGVTVSGFCAAHQRTLAQHVAQAEAEQELIKEGRRLLAEAAGRRSPGRR